MSEQSTQPTCKEAVALELMRDIANKDIGGVDEQTGDPRKYYLTLYWQCHQMTRGGVVSDVLKND